MHLQQFVVQANIYILGSVPCFGFCISTFSCNARNAAFLSWSAAASLEESLGGSWVDMSHYGMHFVLILATAQQELALHCSVRT